VQILADCVSYWREVSQADLCGLVLPGEVWIGERESIPKFALGPMGPQTIKETVRGGWVRAKSSSSRPIMAQLGLPASFTLRQYREWCSAELPDIGDLLAQDTFAELVGRTEREKLVADAEWEFRSGMPYPLRKAMTPEAFLEIDLDVAYYRTVWYIERLFRYLNCQTFPEPIAERQVPAGPIAEWQVSVDPVLADIGESGLGNLSGEVDLSKLQLGGKNTDEIWKDVVEEKAGRKYACSQKPTESKWGGRTITQEEKDAKNARAKAFAAKYEAKAEL